MREGIDVVKLFPAEPLEGVSLPRALAAAFPTARFAPTGGIAPAKLPADLAEPAVLGVGSSFMAEDVPERNNRVVVDRDGGIRVHWTPNNLQPHRELVRRTTHVVRRAGYPLVLTERMDIATNSHMCGTAVMGHDPASSVLDPGCRSHAVRNLWIVDSSCFPPSAALNPALTIAANALRVAARREILQ
jgi:choline dehydrogenase-like flavoprotein